MLLAGRPTMTRRHRRQRVDLGREPWPPALGLTRLLLVAQLHAKGVEGSLAAPFLGLLGAGLPTSDSP